MFKRHSNAEVITILRYEFVVEMKFTFTDHYLLLIEIKQTWFKPAPVTQIILNDDTGHYFLGAK